MRPLRYGAMVAAIVFGVDAFVALQRMMPAPDLVSHSPTFQAYFGASGQSYAAFSAAIADEGRASLADARKPRGRPARSRPHDTGRNTRANQRAIKKAAEGAAFFVAMRVSASRRAPSSSS